MTTHARPTAPPMPAFEQALVADAMHTGIVSCPPETPLRVVARMLATHRIHCVVVFGDPRNFTDERAWRIVTDLDVVRALGPGFAGRTAGDAASSEIVTVTPAEPLGRASELMAAHGIGHVVVVDAESDHPMGIVSSLDLAAAAAWGQHGPAAH